MIRGIFSRLGSDSGGFCSGGECKQALHNTHMKQLMLTSSWDDQLQEW